MPIFEADGLPSRATLGRRRSNRFVRLILSSARLPLQPGPSHVFRDDETCHRLKEILPSTPRSAEPHYLSCPGGGNGIRVEP